MCNVVSQMIDFEPPELNDPPLPEPPTGFQVTDCTIQFTGLCPECRRAALAAGGATPGRGDKPRG